jgi:succinyl-CoA synthetase beta subunit
VQVPVVVRLEGTNAAIGLERLAQSALQIETAATLVDAAERVVKAAAVRAPAVQTEGGRA